MQSQQAQRDAWREAGFFDELFKFDELFSSSSDSEDDMLIDLVQKQCGEERPKVDSFVERVVRRLDDTGVGRLFGSPSLCYQNLLEAGRRSAPRCVTDSPRVRC